VVYALYNPAADYLSEKRSQASRANSGAVELVCYETGGEAFFLSHEPRPVGIDRSVPRRYSRTPGASVSCQVPHLTGAGARLPAYIRQLRVSRTGTFGPGECLGSSSDTAALIQSKGKKNAGGQSTRRCETGMVKELSMFHAAIPNAPKSLRMPERRSS
jgi:hypothetical protein